MSSEALAKPTITKNSSEFKQDTYASLSTGELVVFAVQVLQTDATPVAVEEVVSTCFRLFPHSFALKNYFYWPDSALVARRLHDAKEKGLLKGNATDGYETKGSGKQAAKQVAKALGVSLPVPPKVEVVAPPVVVEAPKAAEIVAEKKEEEKKESVPSAPVARKVKKQAQKKVEKKAPAKKPVAKTTPKKDATTSKKKAQPKATAKKPVKPAPKPKATVVKKDEKGKKKSKPAAKPDVKKAALKVEKKVKPTVKPEVKKVEPKVVEKKKETRQEKTKPPVKPEIKKAAPKVEKKEAKSQPTQLSMPLAPATAWKKAEAPASKPKVQKEAPSSGDRLPIKGEVLAPVAVSKEEKDKAAKVIKQIERSDAYQLYRRNGKRAQIGEFDFRNMLFATMESSAETLKRNLDLFKRYASIHFRTDLIAFLEFCEENFAALMISKVKGKK